MNLSHKSRFPSWLRDALPEQFRQYARILPRSPKSNQITIVFELPNRSKHTIDVFLITPEKGAFKKFGSIGFSYRTSNNYSDTSSSASLCEAVAEALHSQAATRLLKYLQQEVGPIEKRTELFFDQYRLGDSGLKVLKNELRQSQGPIDSVELFLISPCVQSCRFCVYPHVRGAPQDLPPVANTIEWIRAIISELRTRQFPGDIILSGPDCLNHPELNAILDLFAEEKEIGLCLLGPMTLCSPETVRRIASLENLRWVRLSLFGSRPETHDAIVGTPGAYRKLMSVLSQLHRYDIPIAVNTIVTPENVSELPETLEKLTNISSNNHYHLTTYHPESWLWSDPPVSWRELSLQHVVVKPDDLYRALERSKVPENQVMHACPIPRCWIPKKWRKTMVWNFGVRKNAKFLPACENCADRSDCPGILEPALEIFGDECARTTL